MSSKQTEQTEQAPQTTFDRDDPPILGANPFVGLTREQVVASLARLGQRIAVEPGAAAATAVGAFAELLRVAVGRSDVTPTPGDRRFTDAVWQQNPVFHRLMQAYLVERDAAHRVIDEVELDTKSHARAHFAMSLLTEALAPTNFLLTNPDAWRRPSRRAARAWWPAPGTWRTTCVTTAACRRRSTRGPSPSAATSGSRQGTSYTAPRCSS